MGVKVDVNNDGKADFSINITQILAIGTVFASIIGSYYSLKGKIDAMQVQVEQAMVMPKQDVGKKDIDALKTEYDLKIEKVAIQAKENMDEVKSLGREMRTHYKRVK